MGDALQEGDEEQRDDDADSLRVDHCLCGLPARLAAGIGLADQLDPVLVGTGDAVLGYLAEAALHQHTGRGGAR